MRDHTLVACAVCKQGVRPEYAYQIIGMDRDSDLYLHVECVRTCAECGRVFPLPDMTERFVGGDDYPFRWLCGPCCGAEMLPTIEGMSGSIPGITGGLPLIEYLAEIRGSAPMEFPLAGLPEKEQP